MLSKTAIRFARKNAPIPNIEFKIMKNDLERYFYENRVKVVLEDGVLFISPIEMQIAFKLTLGSDKDFEDAKHLYILFKEKFNNNELLSLIDKLGVQKQFERIK